MGCDIHLAVERRVAGAWEHVLPPPEAQAPWLKEQHEKHPDDTYYAALRRETWYDDRNYNCFAILADVRNGYGTAGVDTGDGFVPISQPRGMPDDLSPEVRRIYARSVAAPDDDGEETEGIWLGDHSHSWLSLKELQEYDWSRRTVLRGVIGVDEFVRREAAGDTKEPARYCGGIFGADCVTYSEETARTMLKQHGAVLAPIGAKVSVKVGWGETYAEAAGRFYSEVMPALAKLDPDPANVRIVFGFDS